MRRPLIVIAVTILAVAACSGATGSEDLYQGSSVSGSSGASGASSSGASSSGASSSGASSSGASSSGASSSGTSGVVDAGHDAAGADPGIFCGGTPKPAYCTVGSQVCCASGVGNGLPPTYVCEVATATCGGIPIACDDPADCGTQKCCGEFNAATGYVSVACRATCDGAAVNGDTFVELCDNAATLTSCKAGTTCQPSGSLVGFSICK
jgi:hypothetical protein